MSILPLVDYRSSWNSFVRSAFNLGLIAVLWLVGAGPLCAYTSVRVALDSNILVDGKRVIFAQGTGSLTVLDLETGEVFLRKKPEKTFWYSGKLQHSAYGVLMMSYGRIVLLDRSTFDPVWRVDQCYDAVSNGEFVVSHDGNRSVTCRKVQSGQLCWKIEMEGGWHLLTASGKVVVTTPAHWGGRPSLRVLDLESGRQVLRHEAPAGDHWHQVYFDGQLIHVVDDKSLERDRVNPKPRNVTTLDLDGKVVAKVDYNSPKVVPNTTRWNGLFIWGDKYFSNGRVQPVDAHERKALTELWKQGGGLRDGVEFSRQSEYSPQLLPSGVFVGFPSKDADGEVGQLHQMIKSKGSWKVYAPHLGEYGVVSHVTEAAGRLLLGSSEGHVECLDIESGRPLWLYMFPVIRQTMSYSTPYGMPPYLTQEAAEYRESVGKMSISCGSIPLPLDFDRAMTKWANLRTETLYAGRIVFDPSPDDPFPNLGTYLTWLAVCASLPIVGAFVFLIRLARRKAPKQALLETSNYKKPGSVGLVAWILVLSVSPAYGLLAYGRVSQSWTLALKVIFVMTIVGVVFGTIRLCFANRWLAALLFSGILIGWVYLMLNPLRFA